MFVIVYNAGQNWQPAGGMYESVAIATNEMHNRFKDIRAMVIHKEYLKAFLEVYNSPEEVN